VQHKSQSRQCHSLLWEPTRKTCSLTGAAVADTLQQHCWRTSAASCLESRPLC
jgi:hypothetical protein